MKEATKKEIEETTVTHTTTITDAKATEAGALDGWNVNCDECGTVVASSSIRISAELDAKAHSDYFAARERFIDRWDKSEGGY